MAPYTRFVAVGKSCLGGQCGIEAGFGPEVRYHNLGKGATLPGNYRASAPFLSFFWGILIPEMPEKPVNRQNATGQRDSHMEAVKQARLQKPGALPSFTEAMPLILSFAPNWPIRTVMFQIAGTALILSAPGMWVLPGSQYEAEVVLIKLGVSVFFLLCGMALLMRNHVDNQPEAYFDPIRSELRVLQKNDRGRPQTVLRRAYDSLGCVQFSNKHVELFDLDGSLLMRLPMDNAEVRNALRMQLSGVVNLTS